MSDYLGGVAWLSGRITWSRWPRLWPARRVGPRAVPWNHSNPHLRDDPLPPAVEATVPLDRSIRGVRGAAVPEGCARGSTTLGSSVSVLRPFEREVLEILLARALAPRDVSSLIDEAELVSYEYTGSGYFLEISHPTLPEMRTVCSEPMVIGEALGILAGFVVFMQDRRLTLECHSLGEPEVPASYRDLAVRVEARIDPTW